MLKGQPSDVFSQQHLSYWEEQVTDPWMVSTLSNFRRCPPTFSRIKVTVVKDPDRSLVLRQEVATLLGKGAIEVVQSQEQLDGFY